MISITEIPIGSVVFETVERYKATVVAVQVHMNGCHRVVLQEHKLKDGRPVKRDSVDIQSIEMREPKTRGVIAGPATDVIALRAKCAATGYEGTITVVETGPSGQRDFYIQSADRHNGERVEGIWVPEPLVKMIDKKRPMEERQAGTGFVNCPTR